MKITDYSVLYLVTSVGKHPKARAVSPACTDLQELHMGFLRQM